MSSTRSNNDSARVPDRRSSHRRPENPGDLPGITKLLVGALSGSSW
jgi:hypothetical protein